MDPVALAFELAMLLTLASGLATALWLWRVADLRPLAGFVAMMGLWCLGHLLAPFAPALALPLLLANPFMPNAFLHFAVGFWRGPAYWRRRLLGLTYGVSTLVFLISLGGGASILPQPPLAGFIHLHWLGWLNLAWTIALGIAAHVLLLLALRRQSRPVRRSILALFAAGAWGLLLASSFVLPSLGIALFPWSMLALPSYVLLLVYAVLRYRLGVVNQWASRVLLGLALALVAGLFSLLAAEAGLINSIGALWGYSLLMLAASAWLYPRLTQWVRHLIYPGARIDEPLLQNWRAQLREPRDWHALLDRASVLLAEHLMQPFAVGFNAQAGAHLQCVRQADGWAVSVNDGGELLPGQRLSLEVFASLLAAACDNLERTLALAEEEKRRLDEQHLVELGALSAAMAHELRNPLNIIAMAAARSEPAVRQHIHEQLQRADRLIRDLLVYGGRIQIAPQPLLLAPLLASLPVASRVHSRIAADVRVWADPHRLNQALTNLLDNALAFAAHQVVVEAETGWIRVHNDGDAIDEVTRARLFRPFVGKRPGGSGLGLAIVKRIMDAHGGSVRLRTDCGFAVTFELDFAGERP